ncbi:MAG TPA: RsmE family RNA methyltransferase [Tepidisphaeraceae bacterium]|nr:RsmE family RNA methyltransferase [Tepidisphaeraceae bacterium]
MARRIHVPQLQVGEILLADGQAHHVRNVLRLGDGATVDVFDDAGASTTGTLSHRGRSGAAVRIGRIDNSAGAREFQWTVCSAVPKGERADWMVEKLSELGTTAFIPLAAARSVVLPEGRNKRERWMRIATESARQSRRTGVMRIEELADVDAVIRRIGIATAPGGDAARAEQSQSALAEAGELAAPAMRRRGAWFLATQVPAMPIAQAALAAASLDELTLFIGPEGGWTPQEISSFIDAGIQAVRLTRTILRVETAAVVTAAVVATSRGGS